MAATAGFSEREDGFGEGAEVAEDAGGVVVERGLLRIHDENAPAGLQGVARQARGWEDRERRAEDEKDVRLRRELPCGRKRRFGQRLAEEGDVRLVDAAAGAARHLRGGIAREARLQVGEHLQDLGEALLVAAASAVVAKGRAMHFVDMGRAGLLVEHVDVLRRNALEAADVLQALERAMDGPRTEAVQSVDEIGAAAIVDGRIAVEPADVEDALGIRLAVKSFRPSEVGDAAEGRDARARQAADAPRAPNRVKESCH